MWAIIVGVAVFAFLVGRSGFDNPPHVDAVSVEPVVNGSWDIQWVSRPPGGIQFSDTKRYRVTLIGVWSPSAQDRRLQIMAGNTIIGKMDVHFQKGTGAPTFTYVKNEGAQTTPIGAYDLANGQFWLVCTSPHRHVRGNSDHDTGTQSNVSVRLAWYHATSSPVHTIHCLP